MNDTYYLEEISKPRPGDAFPNVGYVRRFNALLARNYADERASSTPWPKADAEIKSHGDPLSQRSL